VSSKLKIAIAVTGASGSIYARSLMNKINALRGQLDEVSLVMSDNAKDVWLHELGDSGYENFPFRIYGKNDFYAPLLPVPQGTRC
jgi:flavin prenyltransferase